MKPRLLDGKKTLIEMREEENVYCTGTTIIDILGKRHKFKKGWYSEEQINKFYDALPQGEPVLTFSPTTEIDRLLKNCGHPNPY